MFVYPQSESNPKPKPHTPPEYGLNLYSPPKENQSSEVNEPPRRTNLIRMDTVIHSALDEVCCESSNGLFLTDLWPKISSSLADRGLPLVPNVKRAVWENIIEVPGLVFSTRTGVVTREDLGNLSVEDCEGMNLKIVAPEAMIRSFLGISEVEASESTVLPATQRKILERLAVARSNGLAQSELSKELRIASNNLFYQLKRLESQGLIVRHPTIIRKKHSSNSREESNGSVVTTNMLYLYRYGKHLGCQQRLEIIKDSGPSLLGDVADDHVESFDDLEGEVVKEDVQVKDFLPAIKAICDKLEKAPGEVLVVSDLKRDLGYEKTPGHRAWRNICHKLKDARLVEECCTKTNGKDVNCLRLLQKFSPSHFDTKLCGCGKKDIDAEQASNVMKSGLATEQLVELPIRRQVYDLIDAAGSKGLTSIEVCRRLGLGIKEYHKRYFKQMVSKFGLHLQLESHNRGEIYRVWTAGNFSSQSTNVGPTERRVNPQEVNEPHSLGTDLDFQEDFPQPLQVQDNSPPVEDFSGTNISESNASVMMEPSNISTANAEGPSTLLLQNNPHNSESEKQSDVDDVELQQDINTATDNNQLQRYPSDDVTRSRRRSYPRYPHLPTGATGSLREQHIRDMLKVEKFLVKPELHRRLEGLVKKKMDRKTLEHCLNKLQQEGHCKCIHVSFPNVTNCGRSRATKVVLHPSAYDVSPELLGQIHDKMRLFEGQVRKHSYAQHKKGQAVPVLNNVQRIPTKVRLDSQSERAEAMRVNGFVPAKMIRTKLLHIFLWDWVCNFPSGDDALQSCNHSNDLKNPHSTWKLFHLDMAIKSMPLELFLQAVGSVQKIENMVEKCRSGMRLCDLTSEEYKCLMDTQATGRLSWIIDILRRLKLIRLVSKNNSEGEVSSPHTTLTHALELKPYIEEPGKAVGSSGLPFPDIRPRVRHDFVLSSRQAVDEYWNTLEYCYCAAKSPVALLAFPGSAVREVFHLKSWTSARLMTAGQRAELLKRVAYHEPNKTLSFSECKKIAKQLNLTFEQVLRVYSDKRQQRNGRNHSNAASGATHLDSRKRKRHSATVSSMPAKSSITEGQSNLDAGNCNYHLREYEDDLEDQTGPELNEDDKDTRTFIRKRALSRLNSARKKKFFWTEEADRELVIEYARYRAALGAKFNRVDWLSIEKLPAPPDSCKRRMALLNGYDPFKKAVLKLCRILGGRYVRHLENFPDKRLNHGDSESISREYSFEEGGGCSSSYVSEKWDDFDDNNIKVALDNVLRYKKMAKLGAARDTFSGRGNNGDVFENGGTGRKSRSRQLPRKYAKLLNRSENISRRMQESVAIANAAELFKLIFLSNTRAPEVPTLLAETLRRYSEHDLFAAFSYLREKKIMIGGVCNSPFSLSQHFLHGILSSVFPRDTAKRAAKFTSWLRERDTNLMQDGLDLPSDLQCGEVFTLCALLYSGELSILPYLPDEGVGEVEDNRNSKRKCDGCELDGGPISRKSKSSSFPGEGDMIIRREKGFPGIKVHLHYEKIPKLLAIESFKDGVYPAMSFVGNGQNHRLSEPEVTDYMEGIFNSGTKISIPVSDVNESPWEAMTSYAKHLISSYSYKEEMTPFDPNLFRTIYFAIQKAGDNGLSMDEIREVVNNLDENMLEVMLEVLEVFGRALKVNAFDSIHIVDSLYRSKYFLTSAHDHGVALLKGSATRSAKDNLSVDHNSNKDDSASVGTETNINSDEQHRVTILNLPEDDLESPPAKTLQDGNTKCSLIPEITSCEERTEKNIQFTNIRCSPLLPWMNGDGTINERVYKGLIRRVLGIVMQNPGILEDGIIKHMSGLNPQSCRKLLEIMVMDNHISTRKMQQMAHAQPPQILSGLLGGDSTRKSKLVCRVHYFANPMNTNYL